MFNQAVGRIFQIWFRFRKSAIYLNWDEIIEMSPASIRPEDWPEPNDWFYGWNREIYHEKSFIRWLESYK